MASELIKTCFSTFLDYKKEVLAYLSKGLSTSEISDRLFLSVNTIQTYRKRLIEKLETKNVAEWVYKGKGLF